MASVDESSSFQNASDELNDISCSRCQQKNKRIKLAITVTNAENIYVTHARTPIEN